MSERNKVIALLAMGEKAVKVYSGASDAWDGFKAAGTASHHFSGLSETLIGADGLVGNYAENHRSGASAAVWLLFTGVMGAVVAPKFFKKG